MSEEKKLFCPACIINPLLLLIVGALVGLSWQKHYFQSPGVGEPIMNFTVPAFLPDESIQDVSLSKYSDQWKLLFFYPKDGTTVCPTELRALLADKPRFDELNTVVLPISIDSAEDHKEWEPELMDENFDFDWLSDPKGKLSKYLGIYDEANKVSFRGTIVIDPENNIQSIMTYDNSISRSNEEIIRAIAALQTARENGGVCPFGWEEGDETIEEVPEYVLEKDREEAEIDEE